MRPLDPWLRLLVRWLAPADERDDILADLDEEVRAIRAVHGDLAARRFARWQVCHSVGPWIARRTSGAGTGLKRSVTMLFRGFLADVRLGGRRLRQSAGFTVLAVATLGVGLGAMSTVFSVAYAMWLKPLPWLEPDRVIRVFAVHETMGRTGSLSAIDFRELLRGRDTIADAAGYHYGAATVRVDDEPARIVSYVVTPNLFQVLGVRPAIGRDFTEADAESGSHAVMLSHRTWTRRFGRAADITSRTLTLFGESYRVAGVMPEGFAFPRGGTGSEMWVPSRMTPETSGDRRQIQVLARLAPGRTLTEAQAELETVARGLAERYPETNQGWTAAVREANVTASASSQLAFMVLLALVGLFLLLACANLAGLMLARNAARRAERAVCLSLGASRWRLARALLVESGLLAGAGAGLGILLASAGVRVLASFMPAYLPGAADIGLHVPVLAVSVAVALATAFLIGLWPALGLRQMRPAEALGGFRTEVRGASRAQRVVVVAEVALSVTLLVGAAAMVRSLSAELGRDRGYDPRGLQSLNVTLSSSDSTFHDTARRALAFREVLDRVAAVPGVRAAGATTGFPGSPLGILGAEVVRPSPELEPVSAALHAATGDYFRTMGIAVRAGRTFDATDTVGAPGVAIVNEALASRFPGGSPVGRRIPLSILGAPATPFEIVGVVGNISLADRVDPAVFVPLTQASPYWVDLVFRADGDGVPQAVRRAVRSMGPDLLIENDSSFRAIVMDSLALERTQSAFALLVGALALVVTAIGLYALLSFLLAQQRRDHAIRLAIGAAPRQLCRQVIQQALALSLSGLVIGLGAAVLLVRAVGSQVFGLANAHAGAYLAAVSLVLVAALAAAWGPARRVTRIDPIATLRS